MTDEPITRPINDDDNQPATKADVRRAVDELAQATANSFHAVDKKFDELTALIKAEAEETRRHYDVTVEKIEDELKGTNADEISLITDQQCRFCERAISFSAACQRTVAGAAVEHGQSADRSASTRRHSAPALP